MHYLFSKTRVAILSVLCFSAVALAQQTTVPLFHTFGDSDHADASFANAAGIGFGNSFQLVLDSHFEKHDTQTDHYTQLSTSIRPFKRLGFGLGYTFDGVGEHSPLVLSTSLSDGQFWSLGVRWRDTPLGRTSDLAMMLRPRDWVSLGLVANRIASPSPTSLEWQRPTLTSGLTIRTADRAHRLGLSAETDSKQNLSAATAQWFSRLWSRLEVGLTYHHDIESNAHRALFGLRTLGAFSMGFSGGGNFTDGASGQEMVVTARMRSQSRSSKPLGKQATIAIVDLGDVTEYRVNGWFNREATAPFLAGLQTLDKLSRRDDVQGILLKLGGYSGGWAQCEELRSMLQTAKNQGKKIFVFLPFADFRTYALASIADMIITTPTGGYDLSGATISSMHIKGLLDRIGVEAEFVKTGPYKTAPETFTKTRPSQAGITTQNEILDTIYALSRRDIADGRGVSPKTVDEWIKGGLFSGPALSKAKLVDHQLHLDQAERKLRKTFFGNTRLLSAQNLLIQDNGQWGRPKKIAVLFAVGSLVDGETPVGLFNSGEATGSTTFRNAVQRIGRDDNIAGVVVRINSPGGTISASDTMWRVLRRLSKMKPVVVSFGNVSASGGYYTAVAATKIFANQRTLTGSIGVFAGKFNVTPLLAKLGVVNQLFKRGEQAGLLSPYQPWSLAQRNTIQKSIDAYDRIFQGRVRQGRRLNQKTVKALAGGRVYMGERAKTVKLVDEIGGLGSAIRSLKRTLNLPETLDDLSIYPKPEDSRSGLSLPRIDVKTKLAQHTHLRALIDTISPTFSHITALLLTLSHTQFFALSTELWQMQ